MEISKNLPNMNSSVKVSEIKTNFTEKITKGEAEELRTQIREQANAIMIRSTSLQINISNSEDMFTKNYEEFRSFLNDIGYEGKPIAELSQDEAAKLVSEDGFFGITQTSERIANFVINGAAGDEDMLRAGRTGMLEGFKMAEEMWGGELPDISQQTMQKAVEMVDMAMSELGFSIIDKEV